MKEQKKVCITIENENLEFVKMVEEKLGKVRWTNLFLDALLKAYQDKDMKYFKKSVLKSI